MLQPLQGDFHCQQMNSFLRTDSLSWNCRRTYRDAPRRQFDLGRYFAFRRDSSDFPRAPDGRPDVTVDILRMPIRTRALLRLVEHPLIRDASGFRIEVVLVDSPIFGVGQEHELVVEGPAHAIGNGHALLHVMEAAVRVKPKENRCEIVSTTDQTVWQATTLHTLGCKRSDLWIACSADPEASLAVHSTVVGPHCLPPASIFLSLLFLWPEVRQRPGCTSRLVAIVDAILAAQ